MGLMKKEAIHATSHSMRPSSEEVLAGGEGKKSGDSRGRIRVWWGIGTVCGAVVMAVGVVGWHELAVWRAVEAAKELRAEGVLLNAFRSPPDPPEFWQRIFRPLGVSVPAFLLPHPDLDIQGVQYTQGKFNKTADLRKLLAFRQVQHITLNKCRLTPEILETLARFPGLVSLSLEDCGANNEDLSKLSPLRNLVKLVLSKSQVADDGLKIIGGFPELVLLRLESDRIEGWGFQELAKASKLRILNLSGGELGDRQVSACAEAFRETELQSLVLFGFRFGNAGLKSVGQMKKLRTLSLYAGGFDDEALMGLQGMTALRQLDLFCLGLTRDGVARFHQARKDVWIQRGDHLR